MFLVFGEIKGHLFLFSVMCCLQNKEAFTKLGRILGGICGYVWLPLKKALDLLCFFKKLIAMMDCW
jgi:hypothetical protein